MLALHNYIDSSAVTITASPTALAELPTSNLKIPFFDGIARGSSATETVSLSWELPFDGSDSTRNVNLVALLGLNWRSYFSAELRAWNSGGSWASPALQTAQYLHWVDAQWVGRLPRNVFVPVSATNLQFWRLDVTFNGVADGDPWPWEARRLWCGPALEFGLRRGARTGWRGTHASVDGESGIPNVSAGYAYRRVAFEGRALPNSSIYGPRNSVAGNLHDLNMMMFNKGPYAEAILLPRVVTNSTVLSSSQPNLMQIMGVYGKLVGGLDSTLLIGDRSDIAGEIQEVPHPLPSPLEAPS